MVNPSNAVFEILPLGTVRPAGWLLAQMQRDLTEGFAGRLDALSPHASTDLFRQRIESSSQQFAWWDSETRGNWLWGYTMMAGLGGLPEHQARVNALLAHLKHTQDDDGYLGIYSPRSRYQHHDDENGELWAQGRALLALLAHYELTGDPTDLRAAQAAADLTLTQYGPSRPHFPRQPSGGEVTGLTHGLCYTDAMESLYSHTGEARYRDFGVWLYEDFGQMPLPFANDDLAPGNLQNPLLALHGHAVHTAEHLRALLWADQAQDWPNAGQLTAHALRKLRHYALPSGALPGDEGLHGLPTPDIGYEYCTLTELLFSLTSALQKLGDPTLGDWIETLAFNAGQGARFATGAGIGYLSADTRLSATLDRPDSYSLLTDKHGRYKFSPTHDDVACCCNPNAVRFLPHYVSRMWMRLPGQAGLVAAAYGPCTVTTQVKGVTVTIVEKTNYPFSDTIQFSVSVERPIAFALHLRRPAWAGQVETTAATTHSQSGYLIIDKTWSADNTFSITFHPRVVATAYANGESAVSRGPLQYVWPVAHRLRPVKDYPITGFHDYEILPQSLEQAYARFILDDSQPEFGLALETETDSDLSRPWDRPHQWLRSGTTQLVPMGNALLRQAAFPVKTNRLG